MEWLLKHKFPWDKGTFAEAASHGNLKMLKWLLKHRCPWSPMTFSRAIENESLENLQWLRENMCPWKRSITPTPKTLKWLEENGFL